jgi:prolyl-tRNA synthetase
MEIVFDKSLENSCNMICGANKENYHLINVCYGRDFCPENLYDISKVNIGDSCPKCGASLTVKNGIEIGNIFQLGTKYTKSMGMKVLNKEGKEINPIMGCYGIGVGRAIAAVAEEYADSKGLSWPIQISPWKVYICALRLDDKNIIVKANELYDKLKKIGIEVIFDDRDASPGFKFADCDLMGIPIRVVISPRSLEKGVVEIQTRDGLIKEDAIYEECIERIKQLCDKIT